VSVQSGGYAQTFQINLLPSPSGQKTETTGSSSTLNKDGSSMFSEILANNLRKYTESQLRRL
jgi:hypothetical protein